MLNIKIISGWKLLLYWPQCDGREKNKMYPFYESKKKGFKSTYNLHWGLLASNFFFYRKQVKAGSDLPSPKACSSAGGFGLLLFFFSSLTGVFLNNCLGMVVGSSSNNKKP